MQPEKNSYLNVYISIRLFRPLYIFFLGVDPLLYLCNTDLWRVQGREIVLYKSLYLFVLLYGCTIDICKKRERDSYRGVYRFKTLSSSTVRPRSSDPFYVVTYYIKCVTTSWTYSRRMIKLGIRSLYILKANRGRRVIILKQIWYRYGDTGMDMDNLPLLGNISIVVSWKHYICFHSVASILQY